MASSVIKSRMIWLLALIQIIDIAAHVATNQIEILRIISNLIIILVTVILLILAFFILRSTLTQNQTKNLIFQLVISCQL